MDEVIEVLEQSVAKHGEKPLTNRWLLNILLLARRREEQAEVEFWDWVGPDDIY